jgi:hypothetical protein
MEANMPQSKILPIYTRKNDWAKFFEDLDTGNVLNVDEEMYNYFIDILPPVNVGYNYFETQEGDGDRILFKKGICGIYTAKLLRKVSVTTKNGNTFMAYLYRSTDDHRFTVKQTYLCDFNIPKNIELYTESLSGKVVESFSAFIDQAHIEIDLLQKMKPQLLAS